jgi:hypothetical protein
VSGKSLKLSPGLGGLIINPYAFATGGGGGGFSPSDLSDLQLWLDADDASTIATSGSDVTSWTSKDANERVFSQAVVGSRPATGTATQNGKNVIAFASDYLVSDDPASTFNFFHDGTTAYTVFAVAKFGTVASPVDGYALFGNNTGGTSSRGVYVLIDYRSARGGRVQHFVTGGNSSTIPVNNQSATSYWAANEHALLTLESDPANATAASRSSYGRNSGTRVENNTQTATPSTSQATTALWIGGLGAAFLYLTGEIAEFIVYDRTLTSEELGDVESYLADKWGLTLA